MCTVYYCIPPSHYFLETNTRPWNTNGKIYMRNIVVTFWKLQSLRCIFSILCFVTCLTITKSLLYLCKKWSQVKVNSTKAMIILDWGINFSPQKSSICIEVNPLNLALNTHSKIWLLHKYTQQPLPAVVTQQTWGQQKAIWVKALLWYDNYSNFGEALAEQSAHKCGDPKDLGSSPAIISWQTSTIAEWRKITHMLFRSPISPNFSNFGQQEHWGSSWAKQVMYHGSHLI